MPIREKYDIRISESQRQYLITALMQMQVQNYFGADPSERPEIDMLLGMLDDVTDETREFDTVHDFTA
jgi:hypothetical protein